MAIRFLGLVAIAWILACNLKPANYPSREVAGAELGPAPTVTSISPSSWGVKGGTLVTVVGTQFETTSQVYLGGSQCTGVNYIDANTLTCTISSHASAVVDVVVSNTDGQTGTLVDGFKYNSFLYASTGATNKIYSYVIDSGTGAVTATTPASIATCTYPYGIAIDSTSSYLYVACYTGAKIRWYTIDHSNGNLTYAGEISSISNRKLAGIDINPAGTVLYAGVFEASGYIQSYSISGGAPSPVAEYATGASVSLIAVDPFDRFVFTADNGGGSVTKYQISYTPTVTLSNRQTLATSVASNPDGIFVSPNGSYLYTGSASNPGYAFAFSIDGATGNLTEIDAENLGVSSAGGSGIITDSTGTHLYTTALGANRLYGFSIASDGTLSSLSTPFWATGAGPNDCRMQSLGRIVVSADRSAKTVTVFFRDLGTGLLTSQGSFSLGADAPDIINMTQ